MRTNGTFPFKLIGQIFAVFLKIGPSTFGGGYAMLATIEREIVHKKGWMDDEEMGDMVSIAGSAPGGVAVNSAAFIGYRLGGVLGALAAVIGITLPTLAIVLMLSLTYSAFKENAKVEAALQGVHASVVALILVAAWKMMRSSLFDSITWILAAASVAVLLFTGLHSVWLILGGPIVGMAAVWIRRLRNMEVRTEPERREDDQEPMMPEYYI
ncbi:chromate transporter [Saccharibacillus sp. VR-M41]|uniref:Chromate transporter n=2 Tax=Saccharibacillus alkalitolerans TaxID=2705290 RepID=A0ABX0EYS6_9BACL|nr:chromate transporter [Saccharibacillus alkalitolerans]